MVRSSARSPTCQSPVPAEMTRDRALEPLLGESLGTRPRPSAIGRCCRCRRSRSGRAPTRREARSKLMLHCLALPLLHTPDRPQAPFTGRGRADASERLRHGTSDRSGGGGSPAAPRSIDRSSDESARATRARLRSRADLGRARRDPPLVDGVRRAGIAVGRGRVHRRRDRRRAARTSERSGSREARDGAARASMISVSELDLTVTTRRRWTRTRVTAAVDRPRDGGRRRLADLARHRRDSRGRRQTIGACSRRRADRRGDRASSGTSTQATAAVSPSSRSYGPSSLHGRYRLAERHGAAMARRRRRRQALAGHRRGLVLAAGRLLLGTRCCRTDAALG